MYIITFGISLLFIYMSEKKITVNNYLSYWDY